MAIGQISGPLLQSNLLRNGVNLAFDSNLLYLDVVNKKIGINTSTPAHELTVIGTASFSSVQSNQIYIGSLLITEDSITSTAPSLQLSTIDSNGTVFNSSIIVNDNLTIDSNTLSLNQGTLAFTDPVVFNSDLTVNGTIIADGVSFDNFTIGDFNITTNSITNVLSTITEFNTVNGYTIFNSQGIVIPIGTTATRPNLTVTGMVRFNQDTSCLELYNGTRWDNAIGNAVTPAEAEAIGILTAIALS